MRFKKGMKVEVLNKSEDPDGSWWCAEIISGNGRNYYVIYDRNVPDGSFVERVPRRTIRPFPPSEKARLDWISGDIVEVLNNYTWKVGKIIMYSGGECFSVSLLGSSTELVVHSSCIRLRKCWQDEKWIFFRKDYSKCCDKITNGPTKVKFISKVPQLVDDQFQDKTYIKVEDTSQSSARNVKKRARTCPRTLERCTKKRAVEKEGSPKGDFDWNWTWEEVDAVASPRTMFGEKRMHSSSVNRNTETFETNQAVRVANADRGQCSRLRLEGTGAESISSSVGSCGVNKNPCRSTCHPFTGMDEEMESHYDLPKVSATLGRETSVPTGPTLDQGIHSLELLGYRCTMLALYASGSFNWEQERLLTNLRRMLHISNDEHLTELKNIVFCQKNK